MAKFEWMNEIKRKGDKISIDQAIEWLESIPKIGRNVDNCYIEPEDDALEKIIDLLKSLKGS
jgi:hypothetical protein